MKVLKRTSSGSAVILVLILSVFITLGVGGYLWLAGGQYRIINRNINLVRAFYLAEAGNEHGIWTLQNNAITEVYTYDYPYSEGVTVTISPTAEPDVYTIEALSDINAYSGNVAQTVEATVQKNPASKVFDYIYFINNWGWFYGNGITSKGDVRSNGIFSFRDSPRVDGHIYAGDIIDVDESGIRGTGGQEDNQHPGSKKLNMPNLANLSYYEEIANEKSGYVKKGEETLIDKVYGDGEGESGNIILVGTPSEPLEITGPVVVTGDVIVKGTVTGQGTIYAGRNIYLAGDISYKYAPLSPRPANDDPSTVAGWVEANKDKDIVGFAARESVIMGDYTKTTGRDSWYANYWLFDMGDEDVGNDGIPSTRDTGEGDGVWDPEYEDIDGDNVRDYNYNWSSVRTQIPLTDFTNLPNGVTRYSQMATNSINRLDGIFYTNHAFTGRTGYGVQVNGAIISKDEAIIYRNTIQMNYDERIHSRYRKDPNWLINLNLPAADEVDVLLWKQVDEGE